ncbi:hypothetical protein COU37_02140 [Candidatus Micrarchaeota archaeon CG10_big_fil_rev_8_21_14_0_10_45_29]|nr:MAG: hypothetical protein COU37_02140 [Candidatus Micrarchaeota archaeon CG10_big_fil_rev_8_21_14_0_10_45_29]
MGGGEKPADYSHISGQILHIEASVAHLLDEMVETMERGESSGEIDAQVMGIAAEAKALAAHLKSADNIDVDSHLERLDALEAHAQELMQKIPDAVVFAEHQRWAGEIESISTSVHIMKKGLSALSFPHLTPMQRKSTEIGVMRTLAGAKAKLSQAQDAIVHKKHAKKNPVCQKLGNVKTALGKVREHVKRTAKKQARKKVEGRSRALSSSLKEFFSRELEGKLFVDWDTIKMKSFLSGKEIEWPHSEMNAQALEMVFENTSVKSLIRRAKAKKCSLAANFACKPGDAGLFIEFNVAERRIGEDSISCRPFKTKVLL